MSTISISHPPSIVSIMASKNKPEVAEPSKISPFDQTQNADIVLRSSDGVDFYVQRALLVLGSKVFESMCSLPQGSLREKGCDVPIVNMSDDKRTLYQLLLWCDPRGTPGSSLKDMQRMLQVADKYDMVAMTKHVSQVLVLATPLVEAESLKVYAIATRYGLAQLARKAAKEVLRLTLEEWDHVTELRDISGAALHRLQEYHFACANAAKGVATDLAWITSSSLSFQGGHKNEGQQWCSKAWWVEYMELVAGELYKRPRGVQGNAAIALANRVGCSGCRKALYENWGRFSQIFALEIEKKIDEVSAGRPLLSPDRVLKNTTDIPCH
jgi:hypothetical protein